MKVQFIRFLGSVLSAFSVFLFNNHAAASSTSGTTKGSNYNISIFPVRKWYVGWETPITAGTNPSSFENSIFMGEHWDEDMESVSQPLVRGGNGYVLISERDFRAINPGTKGYKDSRLGGGVQHLLTTTVQPADGNSIRLIYAPSTGFFKAAGCCYLNVCHTGQSASCRTFSYSGNGEARSTCPCFYTDGNMHYVGAGRNCRGAHVTGHTVEGPYAYTGYYSYGGYTGRYLGGSSGYSDDNYSKGCPPVVQDVIFCYKFSSCDSKYYRSDVSISGFYISGFNCDAVANPLGGMVGATEQVSSMPYGAYSGDLNAVQPDKVLPMKCGVSGVTQGWCAFVGSGSNFLVTNFGACAMCPTPTNSTVGGYNLTNTDFFTNTTETTGIRACYIRQPTATDDTGTFEFTTSAGSAQTCYYKN